MALRVGEADDGIVLAFDLLITIAPEAFALLIHHNN